MYAFLTAATKRRFIQELRDFWAIHPRYPNLADNIQGKYSFAERPQFGIIVKSGSASKIQFSPDNFMGAVKSYVAPARLPGFTGISVEWVREDSLAIQANGGRFPSPPGVYYCEMTADNQYHIDPLLEVSDERVTMVTDTEGVLPRVPYPGSLRLYEVPSNRPLTLGVDYTVGADGVTIYLRTPLGNRHALSSDYRYPGESSGPWTITGPDTAYNRPIPGCVLVFGRRYFKGDRFAVVVSGVREDAYQEYGGKWELSLDLDVIARDPDAQADIADHTAMFLWATLRPKLIDQGVDIQDVSMTGESEEIYDENADDYFYNSSLSLTVQTDWSLQAPLTTKLLGYTDTLRFLPDPLVPVPFGDPYFTTKFSYETIL